jgi:hypothetical protein
MRNIILSIMFALTIVCGYAVAQTGLELCGTTILKPYCVTPDGTVRATNIVVRDSGLGVDPANYSVFAVGGPFTPPTANIGGNAIVVMEFGGVITTHPDCTSSVNCDIFGMGIYPFLQIGTGKTGNADLISLQPAWDTTGTIPRATTIDLNNGSKPSNVTDWWAIRHTGSGQTNFNDTVIVGAPTIKTNVPSASIVFDPTAFGSLSGSAPNGTLAYCNDCNIANPCTGGGSGAFAKRLNGAWVCN